MRTAREIRRAGILGHVTDQFLRRSPDPLLQLVPLALIDAVRAAPAPAGLAEQGAMLGGFAAVPRREITAQIAAANRATVAATHAAITATLDAIAVDRTAAYARVGISQPRGPFDRSRS